MTDQTGAGNAPQYASYGSTTPTQVVFIDSRVPDIGDLLAGLQPGVEAFVLAPDSDGLQQIAGILSANHLTGLSAIDIVGHGAAGQIDLGSTVLTDAGLGADAASIAAIGAAVTPGGDIGLFSCDTASGTTGQQFISDLSSLAGGVDVAAADHLVGGGVAGASFDLDVQTDAGHAAIVQPFTAAAETNFQGTLQSSVNVEISVVANNGGSADSLIFAADNGESPASSSESFFTPGSRVPLSVDNNLTLVATDPANNV